MLPPALDWAAEVHAMVSPQPQVIVDAGFKLGEGPLWHPTERKLYMTDILGEAVHRWDSATGELETVFSGDIVGGFTMQADGTLLLFMARGQIAVLRDGHLHPIFESLPEEEDTRFNDVIADPEGRVFCGTMSSPDHSASLYRLDTDGALTRVVEGVGTSNGMGFTADLKTMYYIDTRVDRIDAFAYDRRSGEISGRRTFADTAEFPGRADGMTVDAEDHVWCARWDGWSVIRFAPDGSEERRIEFPARKMTSITFGGDGYSTAYFTSANVPWDDSEDNGPDAGKVFAMELGVGGRPEFMSRILL